MLTATISLSFVVPLVLSATLTLLHDHVYSIHEVSNSPTGYTVIAETNIGSIVISDIGPQTDSIDTVREITLPDEVTTAIITIQAK